MASNQSKKNQSSNRSQSYSSSGGSSSRRSGGTSQTAKKMRSGNPQERSQAASELGRSGGKQSHKND